MSPTCPCCGLAVPCFCARVRTSEGNALQVFFCLSYLGPGAELTACSVTMCFSCFFLGVEQAATGLLQQWGLPLALFRTLPYVFAGAELGLLSRPLDEEGELCGEEHGGEGELFDGVWQTSVKRKRVMKMRKHKWRKRRRALRQSAARRVNN